MVMKIYCDKCGREMKEDWFQFSMRILDKDICKSCQNKFKKFLKEDV